MGIVLDLARGIRTHLSGVAPPSATPLATPLATSIAPPSATSSPTPASMPEPQLTSTLGSTALVPVSGQEPDDEIFLICDRGVVVDITADPTRSSCPEEHAWDLLDALIRDPKFAARSVREEILRKCYAVICQAHGVKALPWLAVLRQFNAYLRRIEGPAHRKTYKMFYESARPKKRRVYRIPRAEEVERAIELAQAGIPRVG